MSNKIEYVSISNIRNMERKINNLVNTIDNDPLTQKTFPQKEMETLKKSLSTLQSEIEKNTVNEKMNKKAFDALEKRLKVILDGFYLKHA